MTTYLYREDSGYDEQFDAASDDHAIQRAEEMLREGDWNQGAAERTFRVRASVGRQYREPDGTEGFEDWQTVIVTIDPVPPKCPGVSQHDFEDGPSYGSGGGVRYTSTCRECGCRRTTDTWATDPADGTPFEAVSYEAA